VFGGVVRMNLQCPVCGIAFEREPGYFLGAMYFSYAMALVAATPLVLAGLACDWSYPLIGVLAGGELVLLTPFIFRYSRVLWMYMDQYFDPRP